MAFQLRPYQQQAIDATFAHLENDGSDGLIVIPTGGGKTPVMAEIVRRICERPDAKVLCVTHVYELVEQGFKSFIRHAPGIHVGVNNAAMGKRDFRSQVIFASVQSVYDKGARFKHVDVVIIDEAHLLSKKSDGMYQTLIAQLRVYNPNLVVIGLTATPFRLDSGMLTDGDNALFKTIIYDYNIKEAFDEGYLTRPTTKHVDFTYDVEGVGTRGGDFIAGDLEKHINVDAKTKAAIDEVMQKGANRKSWLVFCSGVKHATAVCEEIKSRGITAEIVTGDTAKGDRVSRVRRFKSGELRALVSVGVLTTGFDSANVDLIALMRPTKSASLYIQIVGRGTRNMYLEGAPLDTAEQRLFAIKNGPKPNCLIEGTLIQTDSGLVPIERVTRDMLVFDGVDFVRHGGAVCNGVQEVISHDMIVGTPDHLVMSGGLWVTLEDCKRKGLAIDGGFKNLSEGKDAGGCRGARKENRKKRENLKTPEVPLHLLRSGRFLGLHKLKDGGGWLPIMREPAPSPQVAGATLYRSQAAVLKSKRHPLQRLRRARDRVSVLWADRDGGMDNPKPRDRSQSANRQGKQQRSLRVWESATCEAPDKYEQPEKQWGNSIGAQIHVSSPRGKVCGGDACEIVLEGAVRRGDYDEIPSQIDETKGRVWDIVNCGRRNRFVANGRIVHNCLVLDFGNNISRFGPIDMIEVKAPGKGGGMAPVKECPECSSICHASVRMCGDCGYEFPEPEKKVEQKAATSRIVSDDIDGEIAAQDWRRVNGWDFEPFFKEGMPTSLMVLYHVEGSRYPIKQWVSIEGERFWRQNAVQWWIKNGGQIPAPSYVTEAIGRSGELTLPAEVLLEPDGKYLKVAGTRGGQPAADPPRATRTTQQGGVSMVRGEAGFESGLLSALKRRAAA